jgi:hypothetical protein
MSPRTQPGEHGTRPLNRKRGCRVSTDPSSQGCRSPRPRQGSAKLEGTLQVKLKTLIAATALPAAVATSAMAAHSNDQDLVIRGLALPPAASQPIPTPASVLPPLPPYPIAFYDGKNARMAWETWFASLSVGDYRKGAVYWASHRRDQPPPSTCRRSSPDFEQGCLEAKRRLATSDVRRNTEPDFQLGWISF